MTGTPHYAITRTDHYAVEQFIERLAALGHDDWLSIAQSLSCKSGERRTATVVLQALIAQQQLGVEAWNVADDVETAVHCSLGSRGYAPSREGASLREAREAAKTAAVALLVRPLLASNDFRAMYRAFEPLIPAPAALGSRDGPRPASVARAILEQLSPVLYGA